MLLALLLQAALSDPVVSAGPDAQSLTVYNQLGLIIEERVVTLPPGQSTIVFEGVSNRMIPQTATLVSFEGVTLERNFSESLLAPSTLYTSLVGEQVSLRRTNPGSGAETRTVATVVGVEGDGVRVNPALLVQTDEGIEALQCSGLPETVEVLSPPDALTPRPELSVLVSSDTGGESRLVLSYLVSNVEWSADYVVTIDPETDEATMFGWLTMSNNTAMPITDAASSVIAGSVQVLPETEAEEPVAPSTVLSCWPQGSTKGPFPRKQLSDGAGMVAEPEIVMMRSFAAPAPMAESDEIIVTGSRRERAQEEAFGDYKLYRVPNTLTLSSYQTKQIAFLSAAEVPVRRLHTFDLFTFGERSISDRPAQLTFDIDNSREGALARSLPGGEMRFYQTAVDDSVRPHPHFLASGFVDDLAIDLPVLVRTRPTSGVYLTADVDMERRRFSQDGNLIAADWTLRLSNTLDTEAIVEVTINDRGVGQGNLRLPDGAVWIPNRGRPTFRLVLAPLEERVADLRVRMN